MTDQVCRLVITAWICITVAGLVDSLRCYICENKASNHMCISEFNLHPCASKRYDTCQTVVAYSDVSEKITITKSCATNTSCSQQQRGTPNTPCILTNPVWVCTTCCHGDACNFNMAVSMHRDTFVDLLVSSSIGLLLISRTDFYL